MPSAYDLEPSEERLSASDLVRAHPRVSADLGCRTDPEFATTPLIIAEVDHLAVTRAGRTAQAAWRRDLAAGALLVEWWPAAHKDTVSVADKYADLGLGLADASLVVLAARFETADIATLDERHFRAIRPMEGAGAFRLLPVDE